MSLKVVDTVDCVLCCSKLEFIINFCVSLKCLSGKQDVFDLCSIIKLLALKCRIGATITRFEAVMCKVVEMLQMVQVAHIAQSFL